MQDTKQIGAGMSALICALLIAAPGVDAQEPPAEMQQCTATVSPVEIESGQDAVQATAVASGSLGQLLEVELPEGSGLEIAAPEDLPRQDMAAEESPRPVALDEQGTNLTVWLNTSAAQPGEYEVIFHGAERACTGTVTIR